VKKESNRIEKKSALLTLILQIVLLCGLFFAVAWKEPNPPITQYGIELGFEVFAESEEANPNQKNNLPMYGRLRRINSYNSLANLI
jgi:hypothetical protein